MIPSAWKPKASMQRVICHWTAGRHKASATDRRHYHILVEGDGTLVRGDPSIKLNEAPAKAGYAAHTLNCNSGSIGISMCCMWNAKESPFDSGPNPMTRAQWDAMVSAVADLCKTYGIPVTPRTVLSHAEVQENLGVKQKGKWDFTRLSFDISTAGAKACGDKLRREVTAAMNKPAPAPAENPVTHTVVKGDTWYGIARKYDMSIVDLLNWNGAKSTDTLRIGRVVNLVRPEVVPVTQSSAAPAVAAGVGIIAAISAALAWIFGG